MIVSIGIDSVEITRFTDWHTHSHKQLEKILSLQEIAYCLEISTKSAERFAVRFAVREAFYKAFSQAFNTLNIPFLTMCKAIVIDKLTNGAPYLTVNWQALEVPESLHYTTHISVTHTQTIATAIIIFSKA